MADINVYFFWPGLIFSIVLSILLTIGLNLRARKRTPKEYNSADKYFDDRIEPAQEGETRTKTGGMIMIGPIPIIFGNGGFRFDKSVFKYALAFFLVVLIVWFLFARIVRL